MSDRYATDFSAPASRRRAIALLCVIALHLGVFYWIGMGWMRMPGERGTAEQRKEIEVKFAIVPLRSEDLALNPHVVEHGIKRSNRTPAMVPHASMTPQEAVAPALPSLYPPDFPTLPPTLDLDKVRQSAVASALAEIKAKAAPENPTKEADNAIGKAISQASRPKCDNDYKPRVAGIGLDGLLKIPSLIGSAITDHGCKW